MKKILTFSVLALMLIQGQVAKASSAVPCDVQIKQVLDNRKESRDSLAQVASNMTLLGGVMLALSAGTGGAPFIIPFVVAGPAIYGAETIGVKHASNILQLIKDATYGEGPTLRKAYNKLVNKEPALKEHLSFEGFATLIAEANASGELCNGEKVPEKHDIYKIISTKI